MEFLKLNAIMLGTLVALVIQPSVPQEAAMNCPEVNVPAIIDDVVVPSGRSVVNIVDGDVDFVI